MITLEGKNAVAKLESKGYFVCNQYDGFYGTKEDEYELYKGDDIVMDNLSEAHIIALADLVK